MELVKNDFTENTETGNKYARDIYCCKEDDIWVTVEIPEADAV